MLFVRSICIASILIVFSNLKAQVSYEGYEELRHRVHFEHAGQRDGEFKLLFSAHNDQHIYGSFRKWIRPNESFLGFYITIDNSSEESVANLKRNNDYRRNTGTIAVRSSKNFSTQRGTFAHVDQPDVIIDAYVGDTLILNGVTFTLHDLLPSKAIIKYRGSGDLTTLPLTATGKLRSEFYELQKKIWQLQKSQWHHGDEHGFKQSLMMACVILIFGHVIIIGLNLTILYFHYEHPILTKRNLSICHKARDAICPRI